MSLLLPTEPAGSIARLRPLPLIDALYSHGSSAPELEPLYQAAIRDTIALFEGSLLAAERLGGIR